MADQKDKAQEKNRQEDSRSSAQGDDHAGGYGKSGGNAGAGKSGKEGMGSEKPSDEAGMGSQKPGGGDSGSQ